MNQKILTYPVTNYFKFFKIIKNKFCNIFIRTSFREASYFFSN